MYGNHANLKIGLSVISKVFRDRFTLRLQRLRDVSPQIINLESLEVD